MKRSLSNVFISLMLIIIAGCGFHLRGAASIPDSLKTMYIQGITVDDNLGRELKLGLMRNGVNVVTDYQPDTAILTVLETNVERRVLSVGSDAKVNEYELYGSVTYKITDDNGQVLSESQQVEARRDYRFDQDQVLGKDEEERLLRDELNQQLVQSILRRLSALK